MSPQRLPRPRLPRIVTLYIRSVALGFAMAVLFVALLLWQDVAGLRGLIAGSPQGWVAFAMLVMFNGVVFSGVQFGIAVMRIAAPEPPAGGRFTKDDSTPLPAVIPVRIGRADRRPAPH